MTEEARALKSLAFWHYAFVATFSVWAIIMSIIGMRLLDEFSAYTACSGVEDSKFTECYEAAKE